MFVFMARLMRPYWKPLVVVLAWELVVHRPRAAGRVGLGAASTLTVLCLPFFVAAPGAMYRMVVIDQLERGEVNAEVLDRLSGILGVSRLTGGARPPKMQHGLCLNGECRHGSAVESHR